MADETILHQDAVEDVIQDVVDENFDDLGAAIANLPAPSATYVEAEQLAQRNAINSILAVLRAADMIPAS